MNLEAQNEAQDQLLPAIEVQRRYSISHMTLYRWERKRPELEFPRPLVINSRRYWYLSQLVAWERKHAGRAAA
ncbi:helix-turn-helix transcriptional regulator [Jiella sp. M17.18]|uniref:helix-turn-helix transcriptional regulator n=1 Tax=Jiella sp. M17.18 TaxID=3234247 RepID=UPI0034DFD439